MIPNRSRSFRPASPTRLPGLLTREEPTRLSHQPAMTIYELSGRKSGLSAICCARLSICSLVGM